MNTSLLVIGLAVSACGLAWMIIVHWPRKVYLDYKVVKHSDVPKYEAKGWVLVSGTKIRPNDKCYSVNVWMTRPASPQNQQDAKNPKKYLDN